MKAGDLITCTKDLRVRSYEQPTFSARGRERLWPAGVPALVLSVGKYSLKLEVLIEGEVWWTPNLKTITRLSSSPSNGEG